MYIEKCLKNIRCDTAGCHQLAKFNINTSSYKGSICLCDDCFNKLSTAIQKIKKTELTKIKQKGEI